MRLGRNPSLDRTIMGLAFGVILVLGPGCGSGGGDDADLGTDVDQGNRTDQGSGGDQSVDGASPPTEIAACDRDDLIIHSIDFNARTVTLLNPGADDIVIDGQSSGYNLCGGTSLVYQALAAATIAPGATLTVDIGAGINIGDSSGGALGLYRVRDFGNENAMIDYVCWGTNGAQHPRFSEATTLRDDETVMWSSDSCVSLASSSLYLLPNVPGNAPGDYGASDPNLDCDAPPPDAGMDMGVTDGGMGDATVDAGPVTLLECDRDHLIIESIDLSTGSITLFNPTDAEITTPGSYEFCQGPGAYVALPVGTVPANGRLVVSSANLGTIDIGSSGMLALYLNRDFNNENAIADWICWGNVASPARLTEAQKLRDDGTTMWDDGGCVDVRMNDTIDRIASTEGNGAVDYSTEDQAALSCL